MPGFNEDRDYFNPDGTTNNKRVNTVKTKAIDAFSFGKVFLYMFIYLAITAGVAFGVGYLINYLYAKSLLAGGNGEDVLMTYVYAMCGGFVLLIILSVIINAVVIKGKRSVLIPSIIYSIVMGAVMSFIVIFVNDWTLIGMAFGITSGIFLIMAIIAMISKDNFRPMLSLGMGLMIGGIILTLVNLLLHSETIYWIVSFALFASVMFVTMYDMKTIYRISTQGDYSKNVSYYCAFVIYVDFINIFIRILYYLAIIFGKKR